MFKPLRIFIKVVDVIDSFGLECQIVDDKLKSQKCTVKFPIKQASFFLFLPHAIDIRT